MMYICIFASCASLDSIPKSLFRMRQNSNPRPAPAFRCLSKRRGPVRSMRMSYNKLDNWGTFAPGSLFATSVCSVTAAS